MKKIIFALAIVLPTIGLVGCDRVEPGNVGIKVNKLGDDKGVGEVVGVGRYWTGWNTEVYIFPHLQSNLKTYDEPFSFQMSDGTTIGYHIGVAYKVNPSKVTTVFQTYRKGVMTLPTPTCAEDRRRAQPTGQQNDHRQIYQQRQV